MAPTQKGKFCFNCQKEVIDFTKFSSIEIARKIKANHNLCGRFTQSQLEQEYISSSQKGLNRLGISLGLGAIIVIAQLGFAQENQGEVRVEQNGGEVLEKVTKEQIQTNSIIITGVVIDNQGLTPRGKCYSEEYSKRDTD